MKIEVRVEGVGRGDVRGAAERLAEAVRWRAAARHEGRSPRFAYAADGDGRAEALPKTRSET